MNVYVLTEGDYSDYHIISVFSSEKKAKETKKILKLPYAEIEMYKLDEFDNIPNLSLFSVNMKKNGDTQSINKIPKNSFYELLEALQGNYNFVGRSKLLMCVFAKDKEHAIKIVNEKRAQLISNNKWGKNNI